MLRTHGNPKWQKEMLDWLVNESCNALPENERGIDKVSSADLLWNLLGNNKYYYSLNDIYFIYKAKADSERSEPTNQ